MDAVEVKFQVDDRVIVPGELIAHVVAAYPDRGYALVCFPTGQRERYPLDKIRLAPEVAPGDSALPREG